RVPVQPQHLVAGPLAGIRGGAQAFGVDRVYRLRGRACGDLGRGVAAASAADGVCTADPYRGGNFSGVDRGFNRLGGDGEQPRLLRTRAGGGGLLHLGRGQERVRGGRGG